MAVAVDHRVFEAGMYFSGEIFHRHGSSLFYNRFVAEWSNQLRVTLADQIARFFERERDVLAGVPRRT